MKKYFSLSQNENFCFSLPCFSYSHSQNSLLVFLFSYQRKEFFIHHIWGDAPRAPHQLHISIPFLECIHTTLETAPNPESETRKKDGNRREILENRDFSEIRCCLCICRWDLAATFIKWKKKKKNLFRWKKFFNIISADWQECQMSFALKKVSSSKIFRLKFFKARRK